MAAKQTPKNQSYSESGNGMRIKELEVINSELSSLKPGRKVYKQQPNSNVFFHEDVSHVMAHAKQELNALIQEYKEAEKTQDETE
ncbi:hypothetical protein LSH36_670g00035 [Paralvinella palmiformis]|uniref:Uncharacterized protein n=1 Tax=Paralvinella palmiformis TaxID=53620 RepID=A0AAD9MWH5_9ANNE|nr:hypothetical protein LSH36_670g00035 [Paralvinella palmiformis]